jgi:hypothetical protein
MLQEKLKEIQSMLGSPVHHEEPKPPEQPAKKAGKKKPADK